MYNAGLLIFLVHTVQSLRAYEENVDKLISKALENIGDVPKAAMNLSTNMASALVLQYNFGITDEDINLNITQLITKNGYSVEQYQVTTSDGYILTMFRIPNKGSTPVFLMHGLLLSSDDWVTSGPDSGLAYLLAAAGFDVWLGNARGNKHSKAHIRLSADSTKFWDFTWDEIGRYDLPAMIDLVLITTQKLQLKYVGHSMGTTSFFVMCSEKPEYNDKISLMVALSAVAWMSHTKSPIIRLLSPLNPYMQEIVNMCGKKEFLPDNHLVHRLVYDMCGINVFSKVFCSNIIFIICGYDFAQLNVTNLPVVYSHMPAGSSTKQLLHYGQGVVSGQFRQFDYGSRINMMKYGAEYPPRYLVDQITVPVSMFYSDGDWLADTADVKILCARLRNVVDYYKIPCDNFNHMDYIWAKNTKTLIFSRVIKLITISGDDEDKVKHYVDEDENKLENKIDIQDEHKPEENSDQRTEEGTNEDNAKQSQYE